MRSFLVSGTRVGVLLALIPLSMLVQARPASPPSGSSTPVIESLRGAGFFEQDFLKASNAGVEDNFGVSVAINETGTLLVVGARYEDSDGSSPGNDAIPDAGAAYVFERTPLGWEERAWLKPSLPYDSPTDGAQFGLSVAISGSTVVVGEPYRNGQDPAPGGGSWFNVGAVYVFEADGMGGWTESEVIQTPSLRPREDQFGRAVAISGDRLAIGAVRDDALLTGPGSGGAGAVYVYDRDGTGWTLDSTLRPSNVEFGETLFGLSLAIDGRRILVGAPLEDGDGSTPDDTSAPNAGAAYLFEQDPVAGTWTEIAYLKAENAESEDQFGWAVALRGDLAAAGAFGEDGDGSSPADNSVDRAGAVYLFEPDAGGSWQQTAYLKALNPEFLDSFGYSTDFEGTLLAISANREDTLRGAAYLFADAGAGWQQQQRIQASNADVDDRFGQDLAIGGGRLVVGGWWEGSDPTQGPGDNSLLRSGAVYVYGRPGFTVGGTVEGLSGTGLVLQNNDGDDIGIEINGGFVFPTPLADGEGYSVSVARQPGQPEQFCAVFAGQGNVSGGDVDDILVSCDVAEMREAVLLPEAVSFENVEAGQAGAPRSLVLANVGTAPLTVGTPALTGTAAQAFEVLTDTCSASVLLAGSNCSLEVRFAPAQSGNHYAHLEVPTDAPDTPSVASLFGIGIVADALFVDGFE